MIRWTQPEIEFMYEFVPGHSHKEITEEHNRRFPDIQRGEQSIKGFIARNKLNTGRTGWFEKGNTPHNKGKTWDEIGLSESAKSNMRKNHFKKGNLPPRTRPVGVERIAKDGYVEVHVSQHCREKSNDQWVSKHRLIWEQTHGKPVPDGHRIIFADGNKLNFDPDNLVCVPTSLFAVINREHLAYWDAESLDVAIATAKLLKEIRKAKCTDRSCKRCGEVFSPRYPYQRTCDQCLGVIK